MPPRSSGSAAGRILRNTYWVVAFGMPALAAFFPGLWELYFIVLVGGGLCLAPFLRADLFRLKAAEREETSHDPPAAAPIGQSQTAADGHCRAAPSN